MPLPVSVIPYVVTQLLGRSLGVREPPSKIFRYSDGSMRWKAVVTRETRVAPSRAAASYASAVKEGTATREVPIMRERVITESPPTCDAGKHANHWSRRETLSATDVAFALASTADIVSTAAFCVPVVPLVATTTASPVSTGRPGTRSSPARVAMIVG